MARDIQRARKVAIAVTLVVSCGACGGREDRPVPRPSEMPVPSAPVPPAPPTAGTLAGTVIEFTATGDRRPVPNLRLNVRRPGSSDGAVGGVDTGLQDPAATTSATGFYMVCSVVGTDQSRTITARKDGYSPTSRQIFGGSDFRIDLELGRD